MSKVKETPIVQDAGKAIDQPWFLVCYMVRSSIHQYREITGRKPRVIYIPVGIEAAVQVDFARRLNKHVKLRESSTLFDIPAVWDAEDFRLE